MEISISPNGLSAAYLNVFNPTSKLSIVNEFWSSDFCGNTLDTRSASLFCAFLRPHYDQIFRRNKSIKILVHPMGPNVWFCGPPSAANMCKIKLIYTSMRRAYKNLNCNKCNSIDFRNSKRRRLQNLYTKRKKFENLNKHRKTCISCVLFGLKIFAS